MIAYKVVKNLAGRLVSVWAKGEWETEYRPGEITRSKEGRLFVFRDYSSADFAHGAWNVPYGNFELWKCKVKGVSKRKTMGSTFDSENDWHEFWRDLIPVHQRYSVLPRTILVDEVTLLEKLK